MSDSESFEFEYPEILSSSSEGECLRLLTPPRLNFEREGRHYDAERISDLEQQISDLRLVNAEERLHSQTEIVTLRSEIALLKWQLESGNREEEISVLQQTVETLKEKHELMQEELRETRAHKEPEEVFRLRTQLGQVAAERDALRAVLAVDGRTSLVLGVVKDREVQIAKLTLSDEENKQTIKLLQNQVHDLKFAKKDVEQDLKLLLGQRAQVQALKAQLVAINENKQVPQLLEN